MLGQNSVGKGNRENRNKRDWRCGPQVKESKPSSPFAGEWKRRGWEGRDIGGFAFPGGKHYQGDGLDGKFKGHGERATRKE